jgi:hypothetical protein
MIPGLVWKKKMIILPVNPAAISRMTKILTKLNFWLSWRSAKLNKNPYTKATTFDNRFTFEYARIKSPYRKHRKSKRRIMLSFSFT